MISADLVTFGLVAFFILIGIALTLYLVAGKNNIWNYPVVAAMYIGLAILSFASGIIFIYQVMITGWMMLIAIVLLLVYFIIVYRLPAKRENIKVENKGH